MEGKAVFAMLVRDCERYLPAVLRNIERVSGLFSECGYVFVENDSQDSSRRILDEWCGQRPRAQVIDMAGLSRRYRPRTIRLAVARNAYLQAIKDQFADFDTMIVMDGDDINEQDADLDAIAGALQYLKASPSCAGVFANQLQEHYDVWAFRHPQLLPGDIWEEVADRVITGRVSDQVAASEVFAKRHLSFPADAPPLDVESGFGGFAIYRMSSVRANSRPYVGFKEKFIPSPAGTLRWGWQTCEHVSFHAGFRDNGERLVLMPGLVNWRVPGFFRPPNAWRSMLFILPPEGLGESVGDEPGRNQPCPCGSGERYKHCHGAGLP